MFSLRWKEKFLQNPKPRPRIYSRVDPYEVAILPLTKGVLKCSTMVSAYLSVELQEFGLLRWDDTWRMLIKLKFEAFPFVFLLDYHLLLYYLQGFKYILCLKCGSPSLVRTIGSYLIEKWKVDIIRLYGA